MSMLDHLLDHLGEGKAKYFPYYSHSYLSLSQTEEEVSINCENSQLFHLL